MAWPGWPGSVRKRTLSHGLRGDVATGSRHGKGLLRWAATGVTGGLFPVLDADITLTPAGEHAIGWH